MASGGTGAKAALTQQRFSVSVMLLHPLWAPGGFWFVGGFPAECMALSDAVGAAERSREARVWLSQVSRLGEKGSCAKLVIPRRAWSRRGEGATLLSATPWRGPRAVMPSLIGNLSLLILRMGPGSLERSCHLSHAKMTLAGISAVLLLKVVARCI